MRQQQRSYRYPMHHAKNRLSLGIGSIGIALALVLLCASVSYSQYELMIGDGATFQGSGTITVKGNITNSGVAVTTTIPGRVVLINSASQSIGTAGNGDLIFDTLSVLGTGTKTVSVGVKINDSLKVIAGKYIELLGSDDHHCQRSWN